MGARRSSWESDHGCETRTPPRKSASSEQTCESYYASLKCKTDELERNLKKALKIQMLPFIPFSPINRYRWCSRLFVPLMIEGLVLVSQNTIAILTGDVFKPSVAVRTPYFLEPSCKAGNQQETRPKRTGSGPSAIYSG